VNPAGGPANRGFYEKNEIFALHTEKGLALDYGRLARSVASEAKRLRGECFKVHLNTKVTHVRKVNQGYKLETNKGIFTSPILAVCADAYSLLLKRSPFFRIRSEEKVKKVEVISIKEKPKEPLFRYKGRVTMGSTVKVIIEDHGTGKSFFVQEGDRVGDFLVLRVDDKEVALKKKGGEEIVLSAVKKEKKEAVKKKEKEEVSQNNFTL